MDSQVNNYNSNLKSYLSATSNSIRWRVWINGDIPIPVPSKNMADSVHLCNFANKPMRGRARATWNNACHQLLPSPKFAHLPCSRKDERTSYILHKGGGMK